MISKTFVLISILLSGFTVCAQNHSKIDGKWTGYLTQEEGGLKNKYNVRFELKEKNGVVSGFSIIDEKGLSSKMEVKGYLNSNKELILNDLKLLEHNEPENVDWCIKQYTVHFKKNKNNTLLEGKWTGKTQKGDCIPGKIFLSRPKSRA